ncbi:MAG: amidohydrolase [Clostridia bacterium]|nr:amidohydrolase [Clostridia bacterium]
MTGNVKKIDVHVHTLRYPEISLPRSDGDNFASPEQLISMYDAWGIECGIIQPAVANECCYTVLTNEEACIISRERPDRFYFSCDLSPRMGENGPATNFDAILDHYKKLGAKGVGELCYNMPFDDPDSERMLCACGNADMPVIIHIAHRIGSCYGVYDELGLPRIERMLKKYPKLKVVGHSQCFWSEIDGNVTEETRMQYPKTKITKEGRLHYLLRTYPNLFCDMSAGSGGNAFMRDEDHAERFIEEFQDRLMFGTDICSPRNFFPLSGWLDKMHADGRISDTAYYKVCRGNAIREFKLRPDETN